MITFSRLGKMGSWGNQLFQASSALALAKQNNDVCILPEWDNARYFKGPFNFGLNPEDIKHTWDEPHFHFTPIEYQEGLDLNGYFQSYKYFDDIRYELVEIYSPNEDFNTELSKYNFDFERTGSIHVRRGDYLYFSQCHPVCSIEYYSQAINQFGPQHLDKFLVFSDDPEWCSQVFPAPLFEIFHVDTATDFYIMSRCKYNIIANSSFSWWAAYLNTNEDKVVVAPSEWFGPAYQHSHFTQDLYYPDWKII